MNPELLASSFHDPAGFLFRRDGTLYRQVNPAFAEQFELFIRSGLYDALVGDGLLIPHEQVPLRFAATGDAHAVLRPRPIRFVSFPYEWSFSQLKDAAAVTLEIMRRALDRGMVLRDASAFNIQFDGGRPILVDTLSFGRYTEGQPWFAYRQFCEHFLAPLALMARIDARLGMLHGQFSDGIPVEVASALLDSGSWLRPGLVLHVHVHARAKRRYAQPGRPAPRRYMAPVALRRLVEHLRLTIRALSWKRPASAWSDYERTHSYSPEALASKVAIVGAYCRRVGAATVFDLGAGTGTFSRIAAERDGLVVAMDADCAAVDAHYTRLRHEGETRILPLVMDVLNPSPASGWAHTERSSLAQRGPCDVVLALALLHHLVLTHGVPLSQVCAFLAQLAGAAVVEFVPPSDPEVQALIGRRAEPSHTYTVQAFEDAVGGHFTILDRQPIADSQRLLYLLATRRNVPPQPK